METLNYHQPKHLQEKASGRSKGNLRRVIEITLPVSPSADDADDDTSLAVHCLPLQHTLVLCSSH